MKILIVCMFVHSYDIALLRLSSNARLNRYVNLAQLPRRNWRPRGTCYVTGWGRTSSMCFASLVMCVIVQLKDSFIILLFKPRFLDVYDKIQ